MKTNRMAWAVVTAWLVCSGGIASAQYGAPSLFGAPASSGTSINPSYVVPVAANMTLADEPNSPTAPEGITVNPNGASPNVCNGACYGGCNGCQDCANCCQCGCPYKYGAFVDGLYLRQRGGEVPYAVVQNGAIGPPAGGAANANLPIYNPVGRFARVDPTERLGFRAGVTYFFDDCCSTLTASYTRFESMDADALAAQPGTAIASVTQIPTTLNAGQFWLNATASESIDFQLIDVDFKSPFYWNNCVKLSYLVGARYGQLDQEFIADYTLGPGAHRILSNVNFTGGGIKFGLDGVVDSGRRGIFGYAKGNTSFLGGRFRADYRHTDAFGGVVADTSYLTSRMVTVADTEIGLGWHNRNNTFRASVGYMFMSWANVMKVNEYINAVRTSNMTDPSDNFNGLITFDGVVARLEGQF